MSNYKSYSLSIANIVLVAFVANLIFLIISIVIASELWLGISILFSLVILFVHHKFGLSNSIVNRTKDELNNTKDIINPNANLNFSMFHLVVMVNPSDTKDGKNLQAHAIPVKRFSKKLNNDFQKFIVQLSQQEYSFLLNSYIKEQIG